MIALLSHRFQILDAKKQEEEERKRKSAAQSRDDFRGVGSK